MSWAAKLLQLKLHYRK